MNRNDPIQAQNHFLHSSIHSDILRYWQQESGYEISQKNLMYPVFVTENPDAVEPIDSMPGQYRFGVNKLELSLRSWVDKGLSSILIFGVIADERKNPDASFAEDPNGPVIKAVKMCRQKFPELLVACDVCLCPYTDHGHCGVLRKDCSGKYLGIDNVQSVKRLTEISLSYAKAGAQIIAPSDMMDGRIGGIKQALIEQDLIHQVTVMSYSAKFCSAFYGPFRQAAKSNPSFGDRRAYQLPPGSRGMAMRALQRDIEQGADIVMIKPGYPYLDLVRDASIQHPHHPIAVYQVSGEYSMIYHSAVTHKLVDLKSAVLESTQAYLRAGARIIITYFAPQILEWMDKDGSKIQ